MENKDLKLYVDSREQSRIDRAIKYYTGQGIPVEVKELPIGDYLFTDGEKYCCFEMKTVQDFIASIQDGRVFNQSVDMAENYEYSFVIIVGNESERAKALAITRNYRKVTVFQYLSAIASLNRYVTVIESYSPYIEESFYRMMTQAKKCLQGKPIVKKFSKKVRNNAYNWLVYCNYGISSKKGQLIVDELGLETLSDLQAIELEDLTSIKGIGEATAQRIIKGLR